MHLQESMNISIPASSYKLVEDSQPNISETSIPTNPGIIPPVGLGGLDRFEASHSKVERRLGL